MQLQQYMLTKTAQRLCMFLSSCFVVSFQNWVDVSKKAKGAEHDRNNRVVLLDRQFILRGLPHCPQESG